MNMIRQIAAAMAQREWPDSNLFDESEFSDGERIAYAEMAIVATMAIRRDAETRVFDALRHAPIGIGVQIWDPAQIDRCVREAALLAIDAVLGTGSLSAALAELNTGRPA